MSIPKSNGEDKKRPILANDPTLRSIENQLKSIVRRNFSGLRLNEIGIEIDRNGKMKIDADKLEKAQLNKSSELENLFNGDDQLLDSIDKVIGPYLQFSSGLFKSRKDSLQESISRVGDKQVALDRKYKMSYDRYIKQFTQMNTLMRQNESNHVVVWLINVRRPCMLMDSGYQSYQQVDLDAQAASASPHQLVIMLIDGLLDELERVRGHVAEKRLAEKGAGINRCMNILVGLDSALDIESGSEIAENLHQLYDFCQVELYRASISNDLAKLANVEQVMHNIREGWVNFGQHV